MLDTLHHQHHDVVVIGGGAAGIGAAVGAAGNGADTLLVDAGPSLGGELLTGMTIDGAINARGEPIVGGVLDDLITELQALDGYVGAYNDYRLIRYHCFDPVAMNIALHSVLHRYGAKILLHTLADQVVVEGGRITGIIVRNKRGRTLLTADTFVDCSGDGDICAQAGAQSQVGSPDGELQPVSIMFRVMGVENEPLLNFIREHPENVAVGESEAIRQGRTDQELIEAICQQGQPTVFFKSEGPLLGGAVQRGEMFPTALIMIQPTSIARKEVCVNATRVAHLNALDTAALSNSAAELFKQVDTCTRFLRHSVPGFENACLSGIAPRIGIRETRRIVGDYMLTREDVMQGRKFADGVAKGCHHIDIHQEGLKQVRIAVADGGSYDIPLRSLIPAGLDNALVAGRCLSADRDAHGSARMMGSCLAMGQAAGTAAAMASADSLSDIREVPVEALRERLREQGAIVDGTF